MPSDSMWRTREMVVFILSGSLSDAGSVDARIEIVSGSVHLRAAEEQVVLRDALEDLGPLLHLPLVGDERPVRRTDDPVVVAGPYGLEQGQNGLVVGGTDYFSGIGVVLIAEPVVLRLKDVSACRFKRDSRCLLFAVIGSNPLTVFT